MFSLTIMLVALSYYSVDGVAPPASFSISGIPALIGAPFATSAPAKAAALLMAIDWIDILRFVLRQQPVVRCVAKICF